MHPNFYHWHSRSDLKTDVSLLNTRWDAAAALAKEVKRADIIDMSRMLLFEEPVDGFASRLTSAILSADPTFPPEKNAALLRVMSAAVAWSALEEPSHIADSIALGMHAGQSSLGRSSPVCADVLKRGTEYLASESDRVRPLEMYSARRTAAVRLKAEMAALKTAADQNNAQLVGKTSGTVASELIKTLDEQAEACQVAFERLAEETQFLWWTVNGRSPMVGRSRRELAPSEYALVAASEAAERVTVLPPATSTEALIEEALSQCAKREKRTTLGGILAADTVRVLRPSSEGTGMGCLLPVSTLLHSRNGAGIVEQESFSLLGMKPDVEVSPAAIAIQFYRELMFVRSLAELE